MLEVPEALLEDRRRREIDRWDEMWEGVLHMAPPPSGHHQRLASELLVVLAPLVKERGLVISPETGLFRVTDDYRIPDVMVARPDQLSDRGVDGSAVLVVEVRSPHDETDLKVPWYAEQGVEAALVIEPGSRHFELYLSRAGRPVLVSSDPDGVVPLDVLGARLSTVPGPALRITWPAGQADI